MMSILLINCIIMVLSFSLTIRRINTWTKADINDIEIIIIGNYPLWCNKTKSSEYEIIFCSDHHHRTNKILMIIKWCS